MDASCERDQRERALNRCQRDACFFLNIVRAKTTQAGTSRRAGCRSPRQESIATDARRVPSALALPAPPPLRSGGHGGAPPPPAARTAVLARAPAQFPTAGAGLALSAH